MKLNNNPPEGFLETETRNGYEISSHMKKVWAVQLDMLQELFKVCERYGLKIFSDGGTTLGAIRHKGYIPWDDDIDMVMPRKDYDKLLEIGPKEFKHPIFFQNIYTDPGYRHRHAQLRNSETAVWRTKQKRTAANSGIFIDIFPLDYMPSSPRKIEKFTGKVRFMKQRIKFTQKALLKLPKGFYEFCRNHVGTLSDAELFRKYEDLLKSAKEKRPQFCCNLSVNFSDPMRACKSYEGVEMMDFEYIKLPVPKGYDELLTAKYGDYMKPVKSPSTHGALNFDPERSYKDILKVR